ncbi:chemotaxis response regulator protein-glutamate methylesterase [Methylobacter sp.]|uniref:protein-glutamate methylesterase/protein-glutamine glutaminase n=1 Tax=Methylobacter sp. TaxID=2051955 RepID=UPI00248904CA|nr:chemotaxis response regulator protein-glutamate methylesterase [Methylobacter sp.]MDI1279045.1 chemotaxis response regulator protein-glutamate methylesterase [Methylobacter sp.]MDI1359836.1 chemotaxis response regulator protein-glutamate methylesterase [Methylobacter sp.]
MIKVLIVDDSAVVRQVLTGLLDGVSGIKIIGAAPDPIFAMKKMESEWPDVIVLDIEMPRMDGVTFLKKLMSERPTPVVICSTLTEKGAEVTMQAMSAGAVDIITKPKVNLRNFLQESKATIIDVIKAAAGSRPRIIKSSTASASPVTASANSLFGVSPPKPMVQTTDRVIVIGTSTGGTQALEYLFTQLPRTAPPIVVVQHMPEHFTAAFAKRLDGICQVTVKEAAHNDRVLPGMVLIAPGGKHMLLQRSGAQYQVEIKDGPLISRHRPSVDVLFRSSAQSAGANAVGIILTGMGDDGAHGMKEMHDAGALTIAQDETSCVVYGMPKEAVKLGAVDGILPLSAIPQLIMQAPTRALFKKT